MRAVLTASAAVLVLVTFALPVFAEDASPPPTRPRTDGESVIWEQAGVIYVSQRDPWNPKPLINGLNLPYPPGGVTPDIDGDFVVWTGGEGCPGCGGQTVQALNRATRQAFVAGGLADGAPAPRVSAGRVFWVGGTLDSPAGAVTATDGSASIFIVDVGNPTPSLSELPSVNGGPIGGLSVNGDRFCWLEDDAIYTARVGDTTPTRIETPDGAAGSCSTNGDVVVIVEFSGYDEAVYTTIVRVDLTTGQRRVIAEGGIGGSGNDNGYVFWQVDNPRRLRGYDPVADRIFQLSSQARHQDPYAEDGVLVWIQNDIVTVQPIAELADASDPNWWQQHVGDLLGTLLVVGIAGGCLLLLALPPRLLPQPRGPRIPTDNAVLPSSPEWGFRWLGLAGICGALLMLVISGRAFTRREVWSYDYLGEEFEDDEHVGPLLSHHDQLLYALVLLLLLAVVSGLQWRQRAQAGATGWIGYVITTLGISFLLTTALDLRDGRGGVLLGVLLLSVGLITLGCATIDGEAPLRWRPLPLLLGLLCPITLPFLVIAEGNYMTVAFLSPFILLGSILFAMLGYSVATVRPDENEPLDQRSPANPFNPRT